MMMMSASNENVMMDTTTTPTAGSDPAAMAGGVAQKLMEHLNNYVMSFGMEQTVSGQQAIPVKVFQDWCGTIDRKIRNDPGFLTSS
jgi:hypothetical protein